MRISLNINNISSRGGIHSLFSLQKTNKLSYKELESFSRHIGHLLGDTETSVKLLIQDANTDRVQLLKSLAKLYNRRNAELPIHKRESKDELFEIYNTVKNPLPEHFNILNRYQGRIDELKNIFSLAQDEESLKFVSLLQRDILAGLPNQTDIITGLLSSKHKKMFMDNIGQFKSYFKLNAENKNLCKDLDNNIDKNKFDEKLYDSKLAVKQLMQFKTIRDFAKPLENQLTKDYTPEQGRFLWKFVNSYLYHYVKPETVKTEDILSLYKSANHANTNLRLDILRNFRYLSKNDSDNEFNEVKKLFKNIEKTNDARLFVKNVIERGLAVNSARELNTIMEQTPLHKANYFFENVRRIVALSDGAERQEALVNELENPFFTPKKKRIPVMMLRDSVGDFGIFKKMQVYIVNKVKSFMYNHFEMKSLDKQTNEQKEIKKLKLKQVVQERKIKLEKEVNEYIKNKLDKRNYDAYEDNFRLKATKIRLALLPEIFDSIKAKRAQSRKLGYAPLVSNADASGLYELINGNNKKIVKFMLQIRDKDENRVFDVKQITELLKKANKEISANKKQNKGYGASEVKAYYNNIYDDLINKYGKSSLNGKKTK